MTKIFSKKRQKQRLKRIRTNIENGQGIYLIIRGISSEDIGKNAYN